MFSHSQGILNASRSVVKLYHKSDLSRGRWKIEISLLSFGRAQEVSNVFRYILLNLATQTLEPSPSEDKKRVQKPLRE